MTLQHVYLYAVGLVFLALAKAKSLIHSYPSPKSFDIDKIQRCIDDDIKVVDDWLYRLKAYADGEENLKGKNVLALGPSSDIGIGLYLLTKGCFQYNACDVNNRMRMMPESFYRQFFGRLSSSEPQEKIDFLKQQLAAFKAGYPSRLNSLVRDDFDLVAAFGPATVDLVLAQAAFEHFDDVPATMAQLHTVCKPGAILVAQADLTTHSGWICQRDPNNIYRYPQALYNLFRFRGSSNRVRPFQYQAALKTAGWQDISIYPMSVLGEGEGYTGLDKSFRDQQNQMDYLSIVLCARKSDR